MGFVKLKIRTTSLGHSLAYIPPCEQAWLAVYLASQLVLLDTPEIEEVVEVQAGELGSPEQFVAEFASALHDGA